MTNLAQALNADHSPGNRYSYYPLSSKWEEVGEEMSALPPPSQLGFGLYIHIPFCREICTYCGCNIKISKKAHEHFEYVEALIQDFKIKTKNWPQLPLLNITFGGGTPNTLEPQAQELLWNFLKEKISDKTSSGQMEADPRYFTKVVAQQALELKIDRITFGVQDFNPEILSNVNRRQRPEHLYQARAALEADQSFGVDLLWGLPKQSVETFKIWESHIRELSPDWISFYPLAKVPWLESIQQAYGDYTLPTQIEKYELYQAGQEIFEGAGYKNLGMGHFIKKNGKLDHQNIYRKVSGLFPDKTSYLLGLGVSAITDTTDFIAQNDKVINRYLHTVNGKNEIPLIKFHNKTTEEKLMNELIEQVFSFNKIPDTQLPQLKNILPESWHKNGHITPLGAHFKKNIMQKAEKLLF